MRKADKKYVAFVCTGNTCRSPMGEAIFNSLAEKENLRVAAESFGTAAINGADISPNSLAALRELGIDASSKKAVSIQDVNLRRYGRFFCMSQNHAQILSRFYEIPESKITVLGVSDPYGGSADVYSACCRQIYDAVKEILKEYEN